MEKTDHKNFILSLPEVTEYPHFNKQAFKVAKKIFVTFDPAKDEWHFKLSQSDQFAFCKAHNEAIYPVNNKWGKQGWTIVHAHLIPKRFFEEITKASYYTVAPKKLAALITLR